MKLLSKGPKFRDSEPINFDKAKSCILTGLEECIPKWCNKNGINENFFFSEWANNITSKIDDRINVLNENLYQCKNQYKSHPQLLGLH